MRTSNLSFWNLIHLNPLPTAGRLLAALPFALAMLNGLDAPGLTVTNFATPSLTVNGNAAVTSTTNGMVLRLTPSLTNQAGSAFLPVALPADLTFSASFRFRLSNAGGNGGAEGIAFVLQSVGASALGAPGASLGYGGITPSLAVEFDTRNNTNLYGTPGDISSNHVAFNTNGTINDPIAITVTNRMNNTNLWYAWVDYTGSNGLLALRLAQTNARPAAATLSQTNFNLAALLGASNVFAGFTGGTGTGCNDQDVLAWQFTAPQPFLGQSITNFPAIADHATSDTVILSAAASSGLPVSFSVVSGPGVVTGSNTLTFTGPGLVSVAALQAGDADWQPAATLTNTFQVKNSQAFTFAPIPSQIITNTLRLNPTASSGLPVTVTLLYGPALQSNGTNFTFTDRGMVAIMTSQVGDANNWPAAPVTNSFRVYALYTLTVVSPFGTTQPGAGAHVYVEDTVLTPRGIEPPTVNDGVITQYLCIGWTMTGHAPTAGNRSSFAMTVTNDASLTWYFKTNLYFHDSFESGFGNWNRTGTWGLSTASAMSLTHAASDSPGAYYTNNSGAVMGMIPAVSLTAMTHPVLHFWSRYDLEDGYDFVYVEGTTNGGAAWFALPGGTFTGTEADWTVQQLDLSAWGAATAFQARFHLVTDSSVVKDGWDMDDVHIGNAPDPLTVAPATTTANSATLNWTASDIGDFAAYRIYRAMTPGQPWHDGRLVGTITGQDTTTFVDGTVAPKTRYYYQIVVVNVAQLFAFSGVIPATTAIGMDYPFIDTGEAGGGVWVADAPWALTTEDAISPTHSWSDSPGGNYTNGIAGHSLTLSSPMSFLTAVNPVLNFTHKYALGSGDYANVEVSINHGADWALLASYSGNSAGWVRGRMPLTSYAGQAAVLVRFRLTSDPSGVADGWHLDDISVTEGLATVNPVTLDQVAANSVRLTWAANIQGTFSCYVIFHDTNAAVGINSPLAGILTNQNTTTFTVTELSPNTTHYFRVYAVNSYGGYSLDAPVAATNTTLVTAPFTDNFEAASPYNFAVTGNWGLTTLTSHSGLQCLTDSPGGNYTMNGDDNAQTSLDLRLASWPVLKFWDKYAVSGNARAVVDVNGQSMYVVNGTQTDWQPKTLDLSWFVGQANVPVKFRLRRWNNEQADGWYVDDMSVAEQVPVPLSYPFYDGFEQGLTNWLPGPWRLVTDASQDGTNSVFNHVADDANVNIEYPFLSLAGWIDLTNALNPQLVFWCKGQMDSWPLYVQAATPGTAFTTIWNSANAGYYGTYGWTRVQVPLTSYINKKVRLAFYNYRSQNIWLDKVIVAEQVQPVTLTAASGQFKSVQLGWTPTASSNVFKRYEVWRNTSAGVSLSAGSLVATVTNLNQTSLTDSNGLSATTTYYYRVFTVDTNEMYATSVNETNAATTPLPYPFSDDLSTLNQWITTGAWGLTTNTAHSGPTSLTDSPGGNYTMNGDDNAQTSLDLRLASWPVLKFWDKYAVGGNARAAVDVNGQSMYVVNGTQTDWQQKTLDLSWFVGQANVPVKFRLRRWNNEQADGWYVDDMNVAEQVPVPLSYPFYDGFEQGLTNWLPGQWRVVTDASQDGTNSVYNHVADDSNVNSEYPFLSLAGWIDLTNAVNPQLVFWCKGQMDSWPLYVQAATPGTAFTTLWNSYSSGFNGTYGWTRVQVPLTSYINKKVRLAFYNYRSQNIWVDKIGVGGIMPGAPKRAYPPETGFITALRPTLTVTNAVHAENFLLTYQFEVYSDASLSTLAAQVPVVAAGSGSTSWPLDINLVDNARYWWRCRAWYGTNAGPWMPTATFYINSGGTPPLTVTLAAPATESVAPDTNTLFSWFAGVDPDAGDFIQFYDFQVDNDPAFGTPEMDDSLVMAGFLNPLPYATVSAPLGQFAGAQNLERGVRYYWRVRSQDGHGMVGPWSSQPRSFYFGSLPVVLGTVTGQVELESYRGLAGGGTGSRLVTFKATDAGNNILGTWNLPLNYAGGLACFSLTNVPVSATHLSAKTAWTLRKRLSVNLSSGPSVANFHGPDLLRGGDLDGSNTVDANDYLTLANAWYLDNPGADIDGDGMVGTDDYFILTSHWHQTGDPE